MGNMCTPVADAWWCMAKPIQYCKVKKIIIIIINKKNKTLSSGGMKPYKILHNFQIKHKSFPSKPITYSPNKCKTAPWSIFFPVNLEIKSKRTLFKDVIYMSNRLYYYQGATSCNVNINCLKEKAEWVIGKLSLKFGQWHVMWKITYCLLCAFAFFFQN